MQFVQAVQHPAELGLIPQVADEAGHRCIRFALIRDDPHAGKAIGPVFVKHPLNLDSVNARVFKFYPLFLIRIRHRATILSQQNDDTHL